MQRLRDRAPNCCRRIEKKIPVSTESEFWMRDPPPQPIGQILIVQIHGAQIAKAFEEREQISRVGADTFELDDRPIGLDHAPSTGKCAELVPFDVAFDKPHVRDIFDLIQHLQLDLDGWQSPSAIGLERGAAVADPLARK